MDIINITVGDLQLAVSVDYQPRDPEVGIYEAYYNVECIELGHPVYNRDGVELDMTALSDILMDEYDRDAKFRELVDKGVDEAIESLSTAAAIERAERRFPEVAAQLRRQQMEALARRGVA